MPSDDPATMSDDERAMLTEVERTAYDGAVLMMQERRNVMIDPTFVRDTLRSLAKARDALGHLYDAQEGPPLSLPRKAAFWEEAMSKSRNVLGFAPDGATEPTKGPFHAR